MPKEPRSVAAPTQITWSCPNCGFENKPRPLRNSLNTIPPGHPLEDPKWRISHCEQCGFERQE